MGRLVGVLSDCFEHSFASQRDDSSRLRPRSTAGGYLTWYPYSTPVPPTCTWYDIHYQRRLKDPTLLPVGSRYRTEYLTKSRVLLPVSGQRLVLGSRYLIPK